MLQNELARLKHKDIRQRRIAVRRLFEIDDSAALSAFMDFLDEDDDWFQDKAVAAMRRWVNSSHRKVVVSLSIRKEIRLRILASELSTRLGSEGLTILSTLCEDEESSVYREAWRARLHIDPGSIPVAIRHEDYIVRKMAIRNSGDIQFLVNMLDDTNSHVRETALNQLNELGANIDSFGEHIFGPHSLEIARMCLPNLIDSGESGKISELCKDPEPKMRKILCDSLGSVNWMQWGDVVDAAMNSNDPYLLPRLLRSRREKSADDLRIALLNQGRPESKVRVLEHLHGRAVSESIRELLPTLIEDSNKLISQVATSLLKDYEDLEAN